MSHQEIILELFTKELHAVIATVGENNMPEAAFIGFGHTDDLVGIFGTSNTSRKYKNIQKNPKVALVIGGWDKPITIQYEGKAVELSGEEKEKFTEIYLAKIPQVRKFRELPDQRFFKIIPTWIRCTGYSKEEEIFEIKF